MHSVIYLMKRHVVFFLLLVFYGCAQSGLTTSEWFTHAQLSSMDISKGDILVKEGINSKDLGDYEGAFSKWSQAEAFFRKTKKDKALVSVHNLFGYAYLDTNDYERSLKYFRSANMISQEINYKDGLLQSLLGQANVYDKLGDIPSALKHLNNASKIAEKFGNLAFQISALEGLGSIYLQQKNYSKALTYYERALLLSNSSTNKELMQSSLNGVGMTLKGMGKYQDALTNFSRSLSLAKEMNDVPKIMDALNNMGMCYGGLGDYSKGVSAFLEALSMSSALSMHFPEKNLYSHYGIASMYRREGKTLRAIRHFRSAVNEIETIRGWLETGEHRAGFLENKIVVYEDLIDLLVETSDLSLQHQNTDDPGVRELQHYGESHAEIAFFFAESTKARSFLEAMARGRQAFVANRIPRELADREKILTGRLTALQKGHSESKGEKQTNPIPNKREIAEAEKELDNFVKELKRHYPTYAAIRYPEPIAIRDVPLQDNEILLEYKVNPGATYLWMVKKGGNVSLIPIPIGRKDLSRRIQRFREPLDNVNKLNDFNPKEGERLFRLLLQQALEGIHRNSHIIIVPDGPLNLLPFEALTASASAFTMKIDSATGIAGFEGIQYVGDQYRISYYPSASIMAVMRKTKPIKPPSQALFALGDPIYDANDPRYKRHIAQHGSQGKSSTASLSAIAAIRLRDVITDSGFSINRLPETRDEVLKIGSLFGYSERSPHITMDMNASEKNVKDLDFSDYKYIHMATHGVLSGDIPFILEPALVLNQVENKENDGFLKMNEVLGLRLNADLVVLSACKTALGKELRGEGIVGLSRAFMLAGAKSVIVSLWSVDSNSTASLMKQFYRYLKSGESHVDSLWLAKQDLKNEMHAVTFRRGIGLLPTDEETNIPASHPFFWAPFILMGEWN
jgi:CHAT domain-containing protein/tetratricopeptide (TPR) repeat protein